jgi:hypothetical protein
MFDRDLVDLRQRQVREVGLTVAGVCDVVENAIWDSKISQASQTSHVRQNLLSHHAVRNVQLTQALSRT